MGSTTLRIREIFQFFATSILPLLLQLTTTTNSIKRLLLDQIASPSSSFRHCQAPWLPSIQSAVEGLLPSTPSFLQLLPSISSWLHRKKFLKLKRYSGLHSNDHALLYFGVEVCQTWRCVIALVKMLHKSGKDKRWSFKEVRQALLVGDTGVGYVTGFISEMPSAQ